MQNSGLLRQFLDTQRRAFRLVLGLELLGSILTLLLPLLVAQAFAEPQAAARNMTVPVRLPSGGTVHQPGNPVKLSRNYEDRYTTPPAIGQHTNAVLSAWLGLNPAALDSLEKAGTIGRPG